MIYQRRFRCPAHSRDAPAYGSRGVVTLLLAMLRPESEQPGGGFGIGFRAGARVGSFWAGWPVDRAATARTVSGHVI